MLSEKTALEIIPAIVPDLPTMAIGQLSADVDTPSGPLERKWHPGLRLLFIAGSATTLWVGILWIFSA